LLAALVLLGAGSLARAEYLLIVVNLNPKPPAGTGNMAGGAMMGGGMLGGSTGIPNPGLPAGGMRGGSMMGGSMMGSGMGSRYGSGMGMTGGTPGTPAPAEADEPEDLVITVLEINKPTAKQLKLFELGQGAQAFYHKLVPGKSSKIFLQPHMFRGKVEVSFLEKSRGVPVASAGDRFKRRFAETFKEKDRPSAQKAVELAFWALEHGLTEDCARVMDKLAETDKSHTAVKAYLEVKRGLERPLSKQNLANRWKNRLLKGYSVYYTETHHYALIHPSEMTEVTPQLDRLERSLKNYYYWWALRGIALPVPKERQVAALTEQTKDFQKLQKNLTASTPVTDSFAARREGLVVLASKRGDTMYSKVDKVWDIYKGDGYDRKKLLTGMTGAGIPRQLRQGNPGHDQRTVSLLLELMENEWEQTGMSHEVSRHLLFSSGLLPRTVNAPEWVQFGMASFFEAPLQSPWATIGAPNPYWLPRFKEYRKKGLYDRSAGTLLRKVVTDSYFRQKPTAQDIAKYGRKKAEEQQLRKARAASWALAYFLAKRSTVAGDARYLPKLQRYFKELSRQPRDMELDEKTLLACFQRAFGDLNTLASNWLSFIDNETLEGAEVHKKIREIHARLNKPPANTTPGSNQGMGPGTLPPRGGRPGIPGG